MYLYLLKYKCYFKVTSEDFSVIISRIFCSLNLPPKFSSNTYLDNLVKCAFVTPKVACLGNPQKDIEFYLVAVENGVLDMKTRSLLEAPSPERFVLGYVPYPYISDWPTPWFDAYLEHISEGVKDKRRFLRAYLHVVVLRKPVMQCSIYIYEPGGTGKTSLTTLANALLEVQPFMLPV